MRLSALLANEEEALLDAAARETARSGNSLVLLAVRGFCQRSVRAGKTPNDLGRRLFAAGTLAFTPTVPVQRAIWEKPIAKQCRVG